MDPGNPVADFAIRLAGKALTGVDKASVLTISVDRGINMPDRFEVVFADLGSRWTKGKLPKLGSALEIDLGHIGKLKTVAVGKIAFYETLLHAGGRRELRVVCYGPRYVLQRGVGAKRFEKSAMGEAVGQSAGGLGPSISVKEASFQRPYFLQANQAGGHVLTEWASRLGLVVLEEKEAVNAEPPKLSGKGPTYKYEYDLREFRAEVNTFQQVSEVQVTCVDPATKAQFVASATKAQAWGTLGGANSGADVAEGAFGEVIWEVSDMPVKSQEEADRLAKALYNDRLFSFVMGQGVGRGNTDLKAGGLVTLENVGTRMSGDYYVTRVVDRHPRMREVGRRPDHPNLVHLPVLAGDLAAVLEAVPDLDLAVDRVVVRAGAVPVGVVLAVGVVRAAAVPVGEARVGAAPVAVVLAAVVLGNLLVGAVPGVGVLAAVVRANPRAGPESLLLHLLLPSRSSWIRMCGRRLRRIG
jgi:phage protein D